jgi:lipoprotein-anchoring transpeptidase ErfK/SrfK
MRTCSPVFRSALLAASLAMAAALAACATPNPAIAPLQSSQSAPAPAVTTGDNWTYRVRDGYTGLERGNLRLQVTESTRGSITLAASVPGSAQEEMQVYDPRWNWLKRRATNMQPFEYSPAYPAFAFPMAPGKTWRERVYATDPADGRRFPVHIEGTVLGWERVRVPAGEFEALKIRRKVFVDYWQLNVRGRSDIMEYEWYAPAVKQSVRRETSSEFLSYIFSDAGGLIRVRGGDRDGGGGPRFVKDDWLVYELVEYTVR